jgi:hypothetical protein
MSRLAHQDQVLSHSVALLPSGPIVIIVRHAVHILDPNTSLVPFVCTNNDSHAMFIFAPLLNLYQITHFHNTPRSAKMIHAMALTIPPTLTITIICLF